MDNLMGIEKQKSSIRKYFSFKNENGKVGLFKVNFISGTDTGNINISIKVQE